MTRTLARGLAPNIRVNAIAPGVILTEFHKKAGVTEEALRRRIQDVPLLRAGDRRKWQLLLFFWHPMSRAT